MLLLTSLILVIPLPKLLQGNGKQLGANSEMASEIYPLSISSISFITVNNIIIVFSILHEVIFQK